MCPDLDLITVSVIYPAGSLRRGANTAKTPFRSNLRSMAITIPRKKTVRETLDTVFRYMNRIDGSEIESQLEAIKGEGADFITGSGERSMCCGDLVELDNKTYLCEVVGWSELTMFGLKKVEDQKLRAFESLPDTIFKELKRDGCNLYRIQGKVSIYVLLSGEHGKDFSKVFDTMAEQDAGGEDLDDFYETIEKGTVTTINDISEIPEDDYTYIPYGDNTDNIDLETIFISRGEETSKDRDSNEGL